MRRISSIAELRPIHPFPARMAPAIVWNRLSREPSGLRVLDPMVGSGTTVVTAKALGHAAIGLDTDPLAVLISKAWSADVDETRIASHGERVAARARTVYRGMSVGKAYPKNADAETRAFVRFWFDPTSRRQLASLAAAIHELRASPTKALLWCAFSRLIITKTSGASLAMDISHSRPHRVYQTAPVKPLARFEQSLRRVTRGVLFRRNGNAAPEARIMRGDARAIRLPDCSVDFVITSPPYVTAIDYLRGHKLSLVWLGYSVNEIRAIRGTNVGAEVGAPKNTDVDTMAGELQAMGDVEHLPSRQQSILTRYVLDMRAVMAEISRVLVPEGRAVLVVGDSTLRGVFIRNSEAIKRLGKKSGLVLQSVRRRPIEDRRRYLPPPASDGAGKQLQARMREEVIVSFRKPD